MADTADTFADWLEQARVPEQRLTAFQHGLLQAAFRFHDGRIAEHDDSFSFWGWARQALGPAGLVLGLPPLSAMVQRRAREDLAEFREQD